MYNVTQAFKDAIKKRGRQFKAYVTIRDMTFDDDNIISLSLNEDVNPSDTFMLGSVASNSLEVTLLNIPGTLILEGAKVTARIELFTGAAFESVPLGAFWVDEIRKEKSTVKLTCVDNMIKLEKSYFSQLNYPASINVVAQEICTKAGVELSTVLPDTLINKIDGYTYREAISFIASFLGGFARFDRLGKLEITSYTQTPIEITGDSYFKLNTSEKPFAIGRLSCKVGEDILSVGASGNEIQLENPIMTQTKLNVIYNTLKTLSYMPYSLDWIGNIAIQAGDKIAITDVKGNTYSTLLMRQKLNYKGGLSATASAVGKTAQAQEFNKGGSIKNTVNRMVIEQANIRLALIEKATIEDLTAINARIDNLYATDLTAINATITNLQATTATINQLNASNARIDELYATKATIIQLNAASAKIEVLESKAASIDTLVAGNLTAKNMQAGFITAESGLIANGAIKDAMILNLSADKINAGKVNTNLVTIQSASGNMLISDNTIQIKDSTRVRVQIGKDASNDYNMYVWDAAGNLMFDATGLKANGIKAKIIRDDMVSDTANIDGKKLNINTVVSSINGATTLLKASKINLDTEAQTLDLAFTSLKSTVTSTSNTVTSQGTAITTIQGQISSKIWQQDITTAVDGVQFGGRNLFKIGTVGKYAGGTVSEKSAAISITGYKISVLSNPLDIIGNVIENLGTEIIISGRTNATVLKSWYRFSNGTQQSATPTVTNGYFVFKLSVPSGATFLNLGLGEYPYTKPYYIENVKVENGNKASDFTSAPEDTEEKITTVTNNYSALNQTVSTISASVSSLQTNTSNLGTRVSSAEGSINVLNNSITSKVSSSDVTNMINADKTILDTRTSNQPPSWYWSNYPKKSVVEFKYRTTINAPGTTTYGSLTTTVPWSDASGGSISQVFRSLDGTYERVSISTAAWSEWKQLEDTKGSQDKINAYNTSTVAPLISRISTAESSITQLDNSIKLKVSQTDVETYVNDIFVATKNNGIELINQDYQKGISTGFPFSNSTVVAKIDGQIGGFGMKGTVFSTSNFIPFDVTKPIYIQFDFYYALRTTGRLYVGFEFFNADKVSMGDNSLCYYVINKAESDIPTGSWQRMEAWLPELTTDTARNTAKYIRIRILTRWSIGDTTNWSYFRKFSVKQLGGQHLSDTITRVTTAESSIDQMAGQIALKVDVDGVRSTIEQNPASVKVAFNKISTNIQTDEGGQFIIRSGALKVYNTRGNHYLSTGYNANGDNYVYTQGRYQAAMEPGRTYVYPDGTTAVNKSATNMSPFGIEHENSDGRNMYIRSSSNITISNLANVMDRALNLFELNGNTIRTNLTNGKRVEMWQNTVNTSGTDKNLLLNYSGGGEQVVVYNGASTGWGHLSAGSLYVTGSKNCIQQTENYGMIAVNAYETAEYYFGDIGSGILSDGKCCIWIEDVFSETVNTEINYHVFLTKYGPGDIWVAKRTPCYIIVEGNVGLEFSWEIKAKRKGFEHSRLEHVEDTPEVSMDFRQSEEDIQVLNEAAINEYNIDELNNSILTDAELNISDLENENNEILNALMEEWII